MENRDLDKLYRGIDIDEGELAPMRERLLDKLYSQQPEDLSTRSPALKILFRDFLDFCRGRIARRFISRVPLFASLALIVLVLSWYPRPSLHSVSLAELEQFVATHGDHRQLYLQSRSMRQSATPIERLNGHFIMTTLGQTDENILASAQGLIEDTRAEFRAYYLEYLLTFADEEIYDIAYIEALMEREEDPECLELLGELLQLAVSRQKSEVEFI